MAVKFVLALVALVAVVDQATANRFFASRPCAKSYPNYFNSELASAFPKPLSYYNPEPACAKPSAVYYNPEPVCTKPAPALPRCPEGPTTLKQKQDVVFPLGMPAKVTLGNQCVCQKYSIKPYLIPCSTCGAAKPCGCAPAPAPACAPEYVPAYAPAPAPAPACAYAPAPAPACAYAPAPAPACAPACAPAPACAKVCAPACAPAPAPAHSGMSPATMALLGLLPSLYTHGSSCPAPAPACSACDCA